MVTALRLGNNYLSGLFFGNGFIDPAFLIML